MFISIQYYQYSLMNSSKNFKFAYRSLRLSSQMLVVLFISDSDWLQDPLIVDFSMSDDLLVLCIIRATTAIISISILIVTNITIYKCTRLGNFYLDFTKPCIKLIYSSIMIRCKWYDRFVDYSRYTPIYIHLIPQSVSSS